MESYLTPDHCDLVTPDAFVTAIQTVDAQKRVAEVRIEQISSAFVGYQIDPKDVYFNLKSTLAQLGINGIGRRFSWDQKDRRVEFEVELIGITQLACAMLHLIEVGSYIGKLFAADARRRVRDPDYLLRMFGRCDRKGKPLLSLGGLEGGG